jgi:GMP reductase
MKIVDDIKLDFSDVLLLPKRSPYYSRSEVALERTITFKYSSQTWAGIPIMVSNMDTTGTLEMAKELAKHKVITCLHKYYTAADILQEAKELNKNYYAVTSGINDADLLNLDEILRLVEPNIICMDVANGYMNKFVEKCKQVRERYPDKIIIAGNVCTSEGVLDLVMNGKVDIVKVGLGNGSCCTTRKQTGIGMPQLSAVMECSDTAHGIDAHIISDGGIQVIGDFSKAYAGGADFVMSGSMFAGHLESGGELITDKDTGKKYKVFYGMSSTTAMNKYSGGVAKYRSSEGKTVKMEYKGPVEVTLLDILGGIRSCMTYLGAKKIKDIPKCATFIRVNRQLNQLYNGLEVNL